MEIKKLASAHCVPIKSLFFSFASNEDITFFNSIQITELIPDSLLWGSVFLKLLPLAKILRVRLQSLNQKSLRIDATHVADLIYSVSSSSRGQIDIAWPKVSTKTMTISMNYQDDPRSKVDEKTLIKQDIPGSQRLSSRSQSRGKLFFETRRVCATQVYWVNPLLHTQNHWNLYLKKPQRLSG